MTRQNAACKKSPKSGITSGSLAGLHTLCINPLSTYKDSQSYRLGEIRVIIFSLQFCGATQDVRKLEVGIE